MVEDSLLDAAWMLYNMAFLNGRFPISESRSYNKRMTISLQIIMGVDNITMPDKINPPKEDKNDPPEIDRDSNNGINIEDFDCMVGFGREDHKMKYLD